MSKDMDVENKIILVVEDEPTILRLLQKVLLQSGAEVLIAGDGPSALEIINQRQDIDLLIADAVLPGGISGNDLITRFRETSIGRNSMLISGYPVSSIGSVEEGVPFLQKPFTLQALMRSATMLFHGTFEEKTAAIR